ncbi:FAD-binding oxidoreductase [Hirschia litorea]|uniref:FAD-binding oxidoreductase n=1 Tax=Hirschia litorea TaxID=1199156 RepID=A0ABW2IQ50_9PROT
MNSQISHEQLENMKLILGRENITDKSADCALFSQDIWAVGELANFVASPENTAQLSQIVQLAAKENIALNPRGGGMSYTKGYIPSKVNTGILDLSKMNRILEINAEDMYVTVQAGCTWKTLNEALKPLGLRTPFWGPLSGLTSTVGGGVSQNNAFFGASTYGSSIDSVTCLTVVLADGTIVKTGSSGTKGAKPFFRQYGPDLTGLFLADAGALAYKAEVSLKLIAAPQAEDWASFAYEDAASVSKVIADMGRLGLACEVFAFDPNLQSVRMKREGMMSDVKKLANVITSEKGGLLKGVKEGMKVAVAGRSYMEDVAYSVHYTVEGHSMAEVSAKMETLKKIALEYGGKKIENSIPKIMRANPFGPLNSIIGPRGERWVPIHGIVPMGDGVKCVAEIEALYDRLRPELDKYEIIAGFFLSTLSNNGYLIEPIFFWPEELRPLHLDILEENVVSRIKPFDANPEATEFVSHVRQSILGIFEKYGAAHLQIGRVYPFRKHREEDTWKVLEGIKALLDPDGRVNAGALGFD